jgi:4-hydroxy-3-methylbut-2-en-1-yl diphosphate synthase IspG/GcpE
MRVLSASDLLTVWERAAHASPPQQALALLSAACPDRDPDALADLSIGHRDALLLRLREATFGPHLTGIVACPSCGEQIEITVNVGDLTTQVTRPALAVDANGEVASAAGEVAMDVGDYGLRMRAPSSRDLMAAAAQVDLASARTVILRRCVVSAECSGTAVAVGEVPEAVLVLAEQRLAEADPQAELRVRLACPACGRDTTTILDIVSFFWREIEAWACRILREVHTLASAYGWTEETILALSPFRRQCYLELVGS